MIKAIETSYAGCRFRSRLEARWAVFLDHMGIKWEYEPQGFENSDRARYLPDFWLPEDDTWIEVKGSEDLASDATAVYEWFAAEVWQQRQQFQIVWNLPREASTRKGRKPGLPCLLFTHFLGTGPCGEDFAEPGDPSGIPGWVDGAWWFDSRSTVNTALTAARSARFEHGQRGA